MRDFRFREKQRWVREKKRKQRARVRRFRAKLINIGVEGDRWAGVKATIGAPDDKTVAKTLIDFYLTRRSASTTLEMHGAASSTPYHPKVQPASDPGISSVTEESSDQQISQIKAPVEMQKGTTSKIKTINSARVEISMSDTDLEDFYDVDYDPDDPTFQPQDFEVSIIQPGDESAEDDYGLVEDVFDIESGDEEEDVEIQFGEGVRHLGVVNETDMTEKKVHRLPGQSGQSPENGANQAV